jgi:predicted ATPase
MAAIANLFHFKILQEYFANSTEEGSLIDYSFKNIEYTFKFTNNVWREHGRRIYLHGFYEGSLIHGNRFRDTHFKALENARRVKKQELIDAHPEIKKNLGFILHDNENHYDNLQKLSSDRAREIFKFRGSPYFLVNEDKLISQLSLSTGENLLLSLLHSIHTQINRRNDKNDEYFVLLDEVEMALHPSALLRLLKFLEKLASQSGVAIYFSTHSTDLIRNIDPNNIFFLNKHHDNTVEVINPCFPAYATRNIYMHDGYDYLILVEDVLTKKIINWLLKKENLFGSKLIHILPCGGWENVIALHQEIMTSRFLGAGKKAFTILDGDVEILFKEKYKDKGMHANLNIDFLPIQSAEKFLRSKLFDNPDYKFFRHFNDVFFHGSSLDALIEDYKKNHSTTDKKGKVLLKQIESELKKNKASLDDIANEIVEYIVHKQVSKSFVI